jgi:alkylation response protein AidB-like acyl-CoA dehydrogenase
VNFKLSEEQEMLRDGAGRFVREHYSFEQRRALIKANTSTAHWQTFAELGWLALGLSEAAGGLGCSMVETAILMEQFGAALVLEPYADTMVCAACVVERAREGTPRSTLLTAMSEGRQRVVLAHSEPNARYDLHAVAATAAAELGGYRINGTKVLVRNAPCADKFLVSARIDGGTGFALFLVDRDAPGVITASYRLLDATPAADLTLESVRVAAEALLVGPEQGGEVLEEALDRLVVAETAYALGAMECALDITAEYVKNRTQFGQPLIKFQATQHRLAEMFVEVQEVRSILHCAIAHVDGEARLRGRMTSAAKSVAARSGRLVGSLAIQLHGGIGMTHEYSVGHYFKHLLVFEKLYGDVDFHLGRFGRAFSSSRPG